ncbi:MAG: TolC family protein [Leptospiraceae bacterium]|nr:TolC family protein [Leptospiraceae bacterium]MCB1200113.1 TolC family protein [Leptospiraceae bacterium]
MSAKKSKVYLISLIFILMAGSCAPSLQRKQPETAALPLEYPESHSTPESEDLARKVWQEFFKDEQLAELLKLAVQNNQELAIVEQEINIANNETMARYGEYLPKVSADSDAGIEQTERFSTEDANSQTRFGRMGLSMSWEIDIWNKLHNATKASYMRYLSSIDGRRYVVTNLVAEVANTYYELMSLDKQLAIVDNFIDILSQVQTIVAKQRDAGRVTTLAVKRFEAEVAKNKARKFEIQQQIGTTENRLNQLLGRYPQPISRKAEAFLNLAFTNLQTSIPVKLLDNRPDVMAAVYNVEAAKLDVEVARARFYPALTIDAGVGYEAFNSEHFEGTPVSLFYGLAAGLTAPVLNRKAIKAAYYTANEKQIQAVYNYEQTLIRAFTEVSNQMIKLKNLHSKFELKEEQVAALEDAVRISNLMFRAARVEYIESLLTQRDYLESQIELVEIKKQELIAGIGLYKAIGGGWRGQYEPETESYWEP